MAPRITTVDARRRDAAGRARLHVPDGGPAPGRARARPRRRTRRRHADLLGLADALPRHGVSTVLVDQPWVLAGRKVAAAPATLDVGWLAAVAALGRSYGAPAAYAAGRRRPQRRRPCGLPHRLAVGADARAAAGLPARPAVGGPTPEALARALAKRSAELAVPRSAGVPVVVVQGERDAFGSPRELARGLGAGSRRSCAVAAADHCVPGPDATVPTRRPRILEAALTARSGSRAGNDGHGPACSTAVIRSVRPEGARVLVLATSESRLDLPEQVGGASSPVRSTVMTQNSSGTADETTPVETDDERRARFERDALPFLDQLYAGSAAHDPQPGRRRGPPPGDLRPRLLRLPPVPGRHEPQGVALPDPHQHLHQRLPQEAARAAAVQQRRRRGLADGRAPRRTPRPGCAPPRPRRSTTCRTPTSRTRCSRSRRTSASRSTSPTSRASPTRRSPRSWALRSAP